MMLVNPRENWDLASGRLTFNFEEARLLFNGTGGLLAASALISVFGRAYGLAPILGILLPDPAEGWRKLEPCLAGLASGIAEVARALAPFNVVGAGRIGDVAPSSPSGIADILRGWTMENGRALRDFAALPGIPSDEAGF